jgi:hypothetical protein
MFWTFDWIIVRDTFFTSNQFTKKLKYPTSDTLIFYEMYNFGQSETD